MKEINFYCIEEDINGFLHNFLSKLVEKNIDIAVQVNGKVRSTININIDEDEDSIKEKALKEENVQKHIEGKEIVKIIAIKGKIVNIVVK